MSSTIQDGQWIVLVHVDEQSRIVKVCKDKEIKLGKLRCLANPILGLPHGCKIEAIHDEQAQAAGEERNKEMHEKVAAANKRRSKHKDIQYANLVRVDESEPHKNATIRLLDQYKNELRVELQRTEDTLKEMSAVGQLDDVAALKSSNTSRDNRAIVDTNSSQKLSSEEIHSIRANATSGEEIVEVIAKNSETFALKTEFSKDKYLSKKKNKYVNQARVLKCTSQTICESLWNKTEVKGCRLGGVRWVDTIPQLLTYSNLHAGSKTLVFDDHMGLLLGCVLERMAGLGTVYAAYFGRQAKLSALPFFNFTKAEMDPIIQLNLDAIVNHPEDTKVVIPVAGREGEPYTGHPLVAGDLDSVILACTYDPTSMLLPMLKFLGPSRPFVVYSDTIEPLSKCKIALEELGTVCNVRLSESIVREYQVLPFRTHPHMRTSASGGYLLSGTTMSNVLKKRVVGTTPDLDNAKKPKVE